MLRHIGVPENELDKEIEADYDEAQRKNDLIKHRRRRYGGEAGCHDLDSLRSESEEDAKLDVQEAQQAELGAWLE